MLELGIGAGALEVVCLGAHPDDIEIGCGGTLLRLASRPQTSVAALVLTGTPDRVRESEQALEGLFPGTRLSCVGLPDGRLPEHWGAVKQALEDLAADHSPHVVLAPRADDAHQDHRVVGELVATVWRDALVLHYEIPKWDADLRPSTHYVALDEETARRKFAVLDASFPSQHGRDWWDEETFLGLMRLRGVECRARYAEGFSSAKVLVGLDGARGGAAS